MKKKNYVIFALSLLSLSVLFFGCEKEGNDDNPLAQDNNSNVGSSSNAFLSDEYYNRLTVEILYMPDSELTQNSVNNLRSFLNDYLNKPAGIEIITREIPSSGQEEYTSNDISNIETQQRDRYNANETIAASLIIVDGKYAENDQVLGIAYRNTSMALFGETIAANS